MKIEIGIETKSTDLLEKRGLTKQGNPFHIREQIGYVDFGKAYPVEARISLEQTMAAYPVGKYLIDPKCLYIDRYGQLALGRLKLIPTESRKIA